MDSNGVIAKRTIQPQRTLQNGGTSGLSLSTALAQVQPPSLLSRAPPSQVRMIPQTTKPTAAASGAAASASSTSINGAGLKVSRGIRPATVNGLRDRNANVVAGTTTTTTNAEKRKYLDKHQPRQLPSQSPLEDENKSSETLEQLKSEFAAQIFKEQTEKEAMRIAHGSLLSEINKLQTDTIPGLTKRMTECEQAKVDEIRQLTETMKSERQDHLNRLDQVAIERKRLEERVKELEVELSSTKQELECTELRAKEEMSKRAAMEIAMQAQTRALKDAEQVHDRLKAMNVRLAEREAALSASQAEARQAHAESQRQQILLESMTSKMHLLEDMNARLKNSLQLERDKVALQRGYMMKRGINED